MALSRRLPRVVLVCCSLSLLLPLVLMAADEPAASRKVYLPLALNGLKGGFNTYLPSVLRNAPWRSPFGVQIARGPIDKLNNDPPEVARRARELGAPWVRIGTVEWDKVQPAPNGAYDWRSMGSLERAILTLNELGLTPMVMIHGAPRWATVNGVPCENVREEYFDEYAAFVKAAVNRYKLPPYNVRYWELGNEPDVDPALAPSNGAIGCWGNTQDTIYYGGERYGRLLAWTGPAVKAADPAATVVMGGLLLHGPETDPQLGSPERFLDGVLQAGGGQYVDIIAYHLHSAYYLRTPADYSGVDGGFPFWNAYGGQAVGKPTFLREVMARHGVNKPLLLNETSFGCLPDWSPCDQEDPTFLENQADFLTRLMVRTLSANVIGAMWFTLNGKGWRNAGLLDENQQPRLHYQTYRTLITQLNNADLPPKRLDSTGSGYAPDSEAYRFNKGPHVVDVVWSRDFAPDVVSVPKAKFIAAFTRDGAPAPTNEVGEQVVISVGFSAVYIQRLP